MSKNGGASACPIVDSIRNSLCDTMGYNMYNGIYVSTWVYSAVVNAGQDLGLPRQIFSLGDNRKNMVKNVQDGAPKIAFSCLISGLILWFMVDITIVNGDYDGL